MSKTKLKPITYMLTVQCVRSEIGVVAEYVASTPFPPLPEGGHLELLDCNPRTWDVGSSVHRITVGKDGGVICSTIILADSPVVENRGFVVKKQNGEEVGPSEKRFR